MIIGIPREIKDNENRVGITPAGVRTLTANGHTVLVQTGGGLGSGISDAEYRQAGARIIEKAADIYAQSTMIIKVKEPLPEEYDLLQHDQILFTYLHLAPEPDLTKILLEKNVVAIAYETVQLPNGALPLLVPMSQVAGRMSVQIGAHFLEKSQGGKGVLLAGVPGVEPAEVVIIGGGMVGTNAARIAAGMGANVTILENNPARLMYLDEYFRGRVRTIMSNALNIEQEVKKADLLIGAVLIPGARAPRLVTEDMVRQMAPGSVIVDVAIDQGGCIATSDRVTTHSHPTYLRHGVVHYAVANMPGAVARTSTYALTNATIPYALKIADKGWKKAVLEDSSLARGLNVVNGKITYQSVADAHNLPYTPLEKAI